MVNAVADSVHAVDPNEPRRRRRRSTRSGTDEQEAEVVLDAPLAFMRSLLCLSKGAHPHATCNATIHFDVWSHHPYTFGGPFGHSKNPDDV